MKLRKADDILFEMMYGQNNDDMAEALEQEYWDEIMFGEPQEGFRDSREF